MIIATACFPDQHISFNSGLRSKSHVFDLSGIWEKGLINKHLMFFNGQFVIAFQTMKQSVFDQAKLSKTPIIKMS